MSVNYDHDEVGRVLTKWKLVQVTNAEKFHSGPKLFKKMHSERDATYVASINYNL